MEGLWELHKINLCRFCTFGKTTGSQLAIYFVVKISFLCMTVKVPLWTLQTLSWMVRPQSEHFYVLQPAVQQQSNLSNCGVFSVAFAYALCKGHPPELCMFNEGRLRSQLYASLTKNSITFSIKTRESEAQANVTKTAVPVYCVCRTAHYKELMVQCCSCQQWYHPTCVDIPKTVIGTDEVWQCVTCH